MIVVTGTHRSGTSLWMQVLAAAGHPVIGEKFPGAWGELFRHANPDGFYESELAGGIFFRTNPHPNSGDYLHPAQTQRHAVKVFIPGLIRTELGFLDRVIATVREWRAYCVSAKGLHAEGHKHGALASQEPDDDQLPAPLAWWAQNFGLLRDIATRGYPVHVQSYESLTQDPEGVLHEVLGWVGSPNPDAALSQVRRREATAPALQAQWAKIEQEALERAELERVDIQSFDALYATIHEGKKMTPKLIQELNNCDQRMRPRILQCHAELRTRAAQRLVEQAPT